MFCCSLERVIHLLPNGAEFTNPYGIRSTSRPSSQSSSDRLSQFGTARDYHEFDMQNDLYWYKENDEDYAMPPLFGISDIHGVPSEDKFVMTEEKGKQGENGISLNHISEGLQSLDSTNYYDKQWHINLTKSTDDRVFKDYYGLEKNIHDEESLDKRGDCTVYSCSAPLCACCGGAGRHYVKDPVDSGIPNFEVVEANSSLSGPTGETSTGFDANHSVKNNSMYDWFGDLKSNDDFETKTTKDDYHINDIGNLGPISDAEAAELYDPDPAADEANGAVSDELLMYGSKEDDYDVFNLKIIHRKNRYVPCMVLLSKWCPSFNQDASRMLTMNICQ